MRGARRLLLLAIVLLLAAIGGSYYVQKSRQAREAPPPPVALPPNINATSTDWVHTQDEGGKTKVEIRARRMRQISEPSEFELEGVRLKVFHKEGDTYDRIESARASFDIQKGTLYSEGEVKITLNVPASGVSDKNLLVIRSSGVHFETATGRATTDRPASFTFGNGEGESLGATYDPAWGEVRLHSEVKLRWRGGKAGEDVMEVEAGHLVYKEDDSRVYLSPWSKLRRGGLTLEAADSTVTLENGAIRVVEAEQARGREELAGKHIKYAAGLLILNFAPSGAMEKIIGQQGARATAVSKTSETTISGDTIFLNFKLTGEDSYLDNAVAMGKGVLRNRPLPRDGAPLPETRLLRSETIKVLMRPGGKTIDALETHAPGSIEFLPNRPDQKRRRLEAERFWIHYGDNNRLRSVRAVKCHTVTTSRPPAGAKASAVTSETWSKDLLAQFSPKDGAMTKLEQWGDFRYEESERKARAKKATLDSASNLITLTGKARVWDPEGSTAADRILLDQASGIYTAIGHVSSTRVPEAKAASGGLLARDDSTHATAAKMVMSSGGAEIVYEGGAMLWQGTNRLHAERIEIDRTHGVLKAKGGVVSQFVDRSPKQGGKAAPKDKSGGLYTEVRAREMIYIDKRQMAEYRGGVRLIRPELDVTCDRLRAYFREPESKPADNTSGTSLDHAIADGNVKIVQTTGQRIRTGLAQHAEYYIAKEMVILRGGRPRMIDSIRGTTQGNQLTYFAGSDRLLIDGAETSPAVSRLHR